MRFRNVEDIASWRLCLGCGACAYACKEGKVKLVDIVHDGIRPRIDTGCSNCGECVEVCPGADSSHGKWHQEAIKELGKGWGPVLEVWEGHAADPEIRYRGSSGGAATALALFCVEKSGMSGVLHVAVDERNPWKNRTYFSRAREDLLSRRGSRYSPSSPCEGLRSIEEAPSPGVFIGKPCDVAALRKAQERNPALNAKTGLAISIFCAGTPSTLGTIDLLERFNIRTAELKSLRYRGMGWPGMWQAVRQDGNESRLTYKEAWGFLQKYRPMRCYLCPDGTGEFSDISCGDPWHREPAAEEPGLSLVIARTGLGRKIIASAMEAGYLKLRRIDPGVIVKSQGNLLRKRMSIWGRLMAMKLLWVPAPRLKGFSLFKNWMKLPVKDKARSVLGTAKRIVTRRYCMKQAKTIEP